MRLEYPPPSEIEGPRESDVHHEHVVEPLITPLAQGDYLARPRETREYRSGDSVLRLIGSQHPEPMIAEIEKDLTTAINQLGIGPMGSGGATSVLAVNVEYSLTHLAGIAVAMSTNCWVARRATVKIDADGTTEELDNPNWFNGR